MFNCTLILKRLLLAFILGGIIGLEREKKGQAAGLRTHILVCLGSCLVTIISLYIYELYQKSTPVDPSRIAASIVTGIGFLGAGAIIRAGKDVRGLTTAASIWISSALGMAVGIGFIFAAVITTILTFFTLSFLKWVENKLERDIQGRR